MTVNIYYLNPETHERKISYKSLYRVSKIEELEDTTLIHHYFGVEEIVNDGLQEIEVFLKEN